MPEPPADLGPAPPASSDEHTYAMFVHLSGFLSYVMGPLALIVTLALWLARRHESEFINDHGREAMNYNLSIWLYAVISTILMLVCVGYFLLAGLVVFDIVIMIVAAVQANGGHYFRYPITIRFVPS